MLTARATRVRRVRTGPPVATRRALRGDVIPSPGWARDARYSRAAVCGIAGILEIDARRSREVVAGQLKLLRHRGPDASGCFVDGPATIGQARLAVIDLVTGDPPITNEDGTVGVALNGEIYNFRGLRAGLLERGHTLASTGDSEVLAHLAEELQPADLARALDGMFAFAVWDGRRRRLALGRDRLGKKPLFYWEGDGRFVFGSEIKAVLAHPAVPQALNPRAIPAYLAFGYVPEPETFFDGIMSLPPAHVLSIAPGFSSCVERYWSPPVAGVDDVAPLDVGREEAAELVRAGLEQAVRRRLVADVPLGAFLSGGLDSSAIVALMAGASGRRVPTFTIGFEDANGFDERPYARLVAERYETEHHEEIVAPNAVELLETLVWHHVQPFGDSSAIPTYLLNQMTRAEVTVALSGDGGDELFAGYERFVAALLLLRYRRIPGSARRFAREVARRLPPSAAEGRGTSLRRFTAAAERELPDAYREWVGILPEVDRRAAVALGDDIGVRDYEAIWQSSAGAQPLDRLLDLNLRTYLPSDLLVKADRMSMAHGLEVRSPFLDTELVELALRLPPETKIRGLRRKLVLVDAVRDLVPDVILTRRKRGFGVPLDRWFRTDLREFMQMTIGACDARVRLHIHADVVDSLIASHLDGLCDHGQALWALLTLEIFLRRWCW
ncbi:MAG TPA: asparagine synthase (glutamine-hydrolyzing) [Solirubrobacteraceae bacterium]|nr:asparagine synthase (glutamine-hydrolyzing) [Solirubrobacteraceae bacterium]